MEEHAGAWLFGTALLDVFRCVMVPRAATDRLRLGPVVRSGALRAVLACTRRRPQQRRTLPGALGAALALQQGNGTFPLHLNHARTTVDGRHAGPTLEAALQSPPTRSHAASDALVAEASALFGLAAEALHPRIPPAIAHAGADHLVLALCSRASLQAMRYAFDTGRPLALRDGIGTFSLIQAETPQRFHARNPFPIGRVYEHLATGTAAAALAGYLHDLGWLHGGMIEIIQGEEMGVPSRLRAEITPTPGASIRVSDDARLMQAAAAT